MYIPPAFVQDDLATLHDFIERHSFGLLVSPGEELAASHLPFLLERQSGIKGRLVSHMARANAQWRQADGAAVLIVFSGPHAYISPSWYDAENTPPATNAVPTWNYLAIHAYGRLRLIEDPSRTRQILQQTVERYEGPRPHPWTLDSATPFFERLPAMIVAFEIDIDRLEGQWKLSQNHAPERRQRVIAGLIASGDPAAIEIARQMQDHDPS